VGLISGIPAMKSFSKDYLDTLSSFLLQGKLWGILAITQVNRVLIGAASKSSIEESIRQTYESVKRKRTPQGRPTAFASVAMMSDSRNPGKQA
jgi:hypothetical protein